MPIYEYLCHACGNDFELLILGVNSESSCPACGSRDMEKKFSVFGMKSSSGFISSSDSSCGGCKSDSCVGCKH